jgi:hypothetical protein
MNTIRQPNARPGVAPFLGESRNAGVYGRAPTSFIAPLAANSARATVDTPVNHNGNRSADGLATPPEATTLREDLSGEPQ